MTRRTNRDRWRNAVYASDLPPPARFVAVVMCEFMDFDDLGSAYPGRERIADMTGLSLGAVKKHLRLLVDAGWLIEQHRGGGRGRASIYRGATPKGVTTCPVSGSGKGSPGGRKGVTTCPPPTQTSVGEADASADAAAPTIAAGRVDDVRPDLSPAELADLVRVVGETSDRACCYDDPTGTDDGMGPRPCVDAVDAQLARLWHAETGVERSDLTSVEATRLRSICAEVTAYLDRAGPPPAFLTPDVLAASDATADVNRRLGALFECLDDDHSNRVAHQLYAAGWWWQIGARAPHGPSDRPWPRFSWPIHAAATAVLDALEAWIAGTGPRPGWLAPGPATWAEARDSYQADQATPTRQEDTG